MRLNVLRALAGIAGLALMGVGVSLLLDRQQDLRGVLEWLGGAVVLHDALIAPLVLLVGLVLVRGGVRGPIRGALLTGGALTAVALPVLLRPGPRANPTVLPLDYPRNWLLTLVGVATVTVLLVVAKGVRRGRRRPPS
ncbi:hypothetical protein AB0L59_12730 [Streptomyces sp. NPDC052109]|uniref:hypothetical protein n=1 Tax=Streptomyces sp. NPDC052109 TaxID=3155527 RepID=UPI0034236898